MSQQLPFLPVVDLLHELGDLGDGRLLQSVLNDCPAYVRNEVARLLPELDESSGRTGPDRLSPMTDGGGSGIVFALRACADIAETARADRDVRAAAAAQRRADQLCDLRRHVTEDPFTPGPMRPLVAGDHASWQAE